MVDWTVFEETRVGEEIVVPKNLYCMMKNRN